MSTSPWYSMARNEVGAWEAPLWSNIDVAGGQNLYY